jgi:AraC-like DNA-binding protein/mannose-6-phosphate isomerase-like protein (cupin superfamily)
MKATGPIQQISLWRKEDLFNVDFASYRLSEHSFSKHFHSHYVIELVVNGTDEFYCNGKNFSAKKNQFVFINPGEVHTGSTASKTPLHYYSLYPDKNTLEKIALALEVHLPPDFSFNNTLQENSRLANKLELLFTSFQQPYSTPCKEEEIFVDFMYDLLSASNNDPIPEYSSEDARVNKLIDFISGNFKKQLSLQNFSDLVHLNPFHLLRIFKKATGLSPCDYLITTRIEFAKTLLRKGWLVQDAAMDAGFYDTSHFYRLFKRTTGISPKDYRSYKSQYSTIFCA